MAHYATLRDYSFAEDVDDIRGADLYASEGKIGTVKDVVFDHQTGDIAYLVGDLGDDRLVLIAADHVFRYSIDEDAFATELTSAEVARLPRFDEAALEDEKRWQKHAADHERYWKDAEKRYEEEFERKWEEDPVMHMKDSERNVTPEVSASPSGEEPIITGADLTPRRIAPKFPGTGPILSGSTKETAENLTLEPTGAELGRPTKVGTRSERLRNFQRSIRERAPELRGRCRSCSTERRVA